MKKSLTFIFAAALLVSCQQEENEATTPANSRITISPIITRATEVNFETGDKIGVTITQNGDFVYAENKQMTYNDGVFAGDLLWYPEGNDKSQIVAYYPYKRVILRLHLLLKPIRLVDMERQILWQQRNRMYFRLPTL